MRTRLTVTAVVVAIALLLGGCGEDSEPTATDATDASDDSESSETTETTETTESTTTTVPVDPEADQEAADAAIAALEADLQADGFVAVPDDDEDDDDNFEFVSEECQEFEAAFPDDEDELPGQTAETEMDSHEREGARSFDAVQASVAFTEQADDLVAAFEMFGDDRMPDCLAEAMELSFEEQSAEPDQVPFVVEGLEVEGGTVDGLGDENVQLVMTTTMVGGGTELPVTMDVLVVRVDRIAVMAMVTAVGSDVPGLSAEDVADLLLSEAQGGEA